MSLSNSSVVATALVRNISATARGRAILDLYPPWEQFNFSQDCTAYGDWLSVATNPLRYDKTSIVGYNNNQLDVLLHVSFPEDWNKTFSFDTDETEADAVYWADLALIAEHARLTNFSSFHHKLYVEPVDTCLDAYCQAIGFVGNNEYTGIGVMISYYMGSALATMFLMAFTLEKIRSKRIKTAFREGKPYRASDKITRVLNAFHGSASVFLSSGMMLSTAMLIAGICVIGERMHDNKKDTNEQEVWFGTTVWYEMSLLLLSCVFGVFPPLVTYCFVGHPQGNWGGANKVWLRRAVLFLMWVMATVIAFLAPMAEIDWNDKNSVYYCDQRGGSSYWNGIKAGQFLVIGVPLFWMQVLLLFKTGFGFKGLAENAWLQRLKKSSWSIPAYINLFLMWGVLGYLQMYRQRIREASGKLGDESKWTFGQVLAVMTWVPPIGEFIWYLIFGLDEGLSGKLPPEYMAVLRSSDDPEGVHGLPPSYKSHPGAGFGTGFETDTGYKPVPRVVSAANTFYNTSGNAVTFMPVQAPTIFPVQSPPPIVPYQSPPITSTTVTYSQVIPDGYYMNGPNGWELVSESQRLMGGGSYLRVVNGQVVPDWNPGQRM